MKKIENSFAVTGFIGKDVEIRSFETASVARFSIAVSRADKTGEETSYVSAFMGIEAWRKNEVIPGSDQIIVNGGVNIEEKPIWIEAPHIYKKNGRYYLMCAEGGTGGWHSEVIFVSDHPKGPYQPANSNPILTQRYFPANRENKVDWAGHADLGEG